MGGDISVDLRIVAGDRGDVIPFDAIHPAIIPPSDLQVRAIRWGRSFRASGYRDPIIAPSDMFIGDLPGPVVGRHPHLRQ